MSDDLSKAAGLTMHAEYTPVEVRANTVRTDPITTTREALEAAAFWFQEYADGHVNKGHVDKAARNQRRADDMRHALAALASLPPAPVASEGPTEWFWRIVDKHGLANVSSFEEKALHELCERARQWETMKREARPAPREDEAVQMLREENDHLREKAADAESTLNAWFDRSKLAHEFVDQAVLDATRGYLRTARSGGMLKKTSDAVEAVIADMVRLSMFANLFARATLDSAPAIQRKHND